MKTSLFKFIIINFIIFSIVSCSPKGIIDTHTINIEYVVSTSTGFKSNIYESTSHTYIDNEVFEPKQYKKIIFGYDFIGIYTDPNLMETFEIQSSIKETFTLYYAYEPKSVIVEFDFKGGTSSEPQRSTFKYGDLLKTNVNLKLDEHIFLGFFMNTSSGERQISNQDGVIGNLKLNKETFPDLFDQEKETYTLNLYAKYLIKTYTLELIYGQTAYEDKNIPLNSGDDISTLIPAKIDDIIDDQNNIYVRFVGWSLLETRNLPLQDTTITNSIKLYALWQPLIYINVIQEEPLILLPNQSVGTHLLDTPSNRIGHTFLHWKTPDGTIHFLNDSITIPSSGLRLDALFVVTDFFIKFNNININSITFNINTLDFELPILDQEGFVFDGWFEDDEFNKKFEKENIEFKDYHLHQKFSPKEYFIDFVLNGGTLIQKVSFKFGSLVSNLPDPFKENSIFKGWYIDEILEIPYSPVDMPVGGIKLYAKWQKKPNVSPVIYIENGEVKVSNSLEHFVYFLDGVLYEGDFDDLEPGMYSLSSKNLKSSDDESDSDYSNTIVFEKLAPPSIFIENQLLISNLENVMWLINSERFDLIWKNLDAGQYNINAIQLSSNDNEINSSISNTLTFQKLEAPNIFIENGQIKLTNTLNTQLYYINDVLFDLDFNKLPAGEYKLQVKNLSISDQQIESELSLPYIFTKLDASMRINLSPDETRYIFRLDLIDGISFDIVIEFYDDLRFLDSKTIYNASTLIYELKNRTLGISNNIKVFIYLKSSISTIISSISSITFP